MASATRGVACHLADTRTIAARKLDTGICIGKDRSDIPARGTGFWTLEWKPGWVGEKPRVYPSQIPPAGGRFPREIRCVPTSPAT